MWAVALATIATNAYLYRSARPFLYSDGNAIPANDVEHRMNASADLFHAGKVRPEDMREALEKRGVPTEAHNYRAVFLAHLLSIKPRQSTAGLFPNPLRTGQPTQPGERLPWKSLDRLVCYD